MSLTELKALANYEKKNLDKSQNTPKSLVSYAVCMD